MTHKPDSIALSFGKAAQNYETHGFLQQKAAQEFRQFLQRWLVELPEGPALELGCGTGLVSAQAAELLGQRSFHLSDLSQQMLAEARSNLTAFPWLTYGVLDANQSLDPGHYSLVLSALAVQWLADPLASIENLALALKPRGKLVLSFLGAGSFPEWEQATQALGLPYTANPLPDAQQVKSRLSALPGKLEIYRCALVLTFPKARDFFHNFKDIGAGTKLKQLQLTRGQTKLLIQYLDTQYPEGFEASHHVYYLCYEAPGVELP